MVAGVFVLAAPVAILAIGGVVVTGAVKRRSTPAGEGTPAATGIEKHHAVVQALKEEVDATKERADYLNSLNILLQSAIERLQEDLGQPESQGPDE